MGRLGCGRGGLPTGASMPSQSRTKPTSPNGTPVCAMPKGPGFMPRKITRLRDARVARDVARVRPPRVVERVVDAGDRRPEAQRCDLADEIAGRGGDPPGYAGARPFRHAAGVRGRRVGSASCACGSGRVSLAPADL